MTLILNSTKWSLIFFWLFFSVWTCQTEGLDCGEEAAKWVSDFLGQEGLRIVYYSHDLKKRTFIDETKRWFTRTVDTDLVGYNNC